MTAIFSFTGYIGVNFVLALVKLFGALLAVTGKRFTPHSPLLNGIESLLNHDTVDIHSIALFTWSGKSLGRG